MLGLHTEQLNPLALFWKIKRVRKRLAINMFAGVQDTWHSAKAVLPIATHNSLKTRCFQEGTTNLEVLCVFRQLNCQGSGLQICKCTGMKPTQNISQKKTTNYRELHRGSFGFKQAPMVVKYKTPCQDRFMNTHIRVCTILYVRGACGRASVRPARRARRHAGSCRRAGVAVHVYAKSCLFVCACVCAFNRLGACVSVC